jgi:hypothetical protein
MRIDRNRRPPLILFEKLLLVLGSLVRDLHLRRHRRIPLLVQYR